ncbi:MAG: ABC transporter ATP-binding protein [Pirellulales bacterium]
MSQLQITNVTKEYPTRTDPLVVLRGVSLSVAAGENVAILGPSGSGKSTLLYILGTLERPTSGSVSIDGRDPFALDEPALAKFRNTAIGFVFQDHHLLPQCSVLENVLIPTIAGGAAANSSIDRARSLLDRVGLAHRLDHRPAELSGGERQRVAIARAMINRPRLLLADEPTGNLDRTTASSVAQMLLDLPREEQTMLITVTHSLELAALMQNRYELDDGKLVEQNGSEHA